MGIDQAGTVGSRASTQRPLPAKAQTAPAWSRVVSRTAGTRRGRVWEGQGWRVCIVQRYHPLPLLLRLALVGGCATYDPTSFRLQTFSTYIFVPLKRHHVASVGGDDQRQRTAVRGNHFCKGLRNHDIYVPDKLPLNFHLRLRRRFAGGPVSGTKVVAARR